MNKIPFIEKRESIDPAISKLFNIVVNLKGLNNPKDVGFCTIIYSKYFKENKVYNFEEAVKFYLRQQVGLRNKLIKYQDLVGVYSLELLYELDIFLKNGSKEIVGFESIKGKNQYKSYTHKVVSLFWKNNLETTIKKIKKWRESIVLPFEEIHSLGKNYLFNLLTIESMIGTIIENDIIDRLSKNYNIEKNYEDEFNGVDVIIDNIKISIKSNHYLNSGYKRNANNNKEADCFILYKIIGDSYEIIKDSGFKIH